MVNKIRRLSIHVNLSVPVDVTAVGTVFNFDPARVHHAEEHRDPPRPGRSRRGAASEIISHQLEPIGMTSGMPAQEGSWRRRAATQIHAFWQVVAPVAPPGFGPTRSSWAATLPGGLSAWRIRRRSEYNGGRAPRPGRDVQCGEGRGDSLICSGAVVSEGTM